ncbi:hypothetical protein ABET52_06175 [Saccharococcus caldoxylosilyticus]|uniref:hypothetical protein n=1 Tax=Saccharococcus caldoxylosilyticus TaxID=81408 RepID=UPI003D33E7F4
MRTIKIDEKEIGLQASPLALLFYKQAFGTDLVGDLVKMQELEKDPSKLDSVLLLQITWAMAKAYAGLNAKFPDFVNWLAELESFDITDEDVLAAIFEEAERGFFRRGSRTATK